MILDQILSRRQLAARSAAVSAAAVTPFPKIVEPIKAHAQGTPTPIVAPPERQVLRWGGTDPLTRLGVHRYGGFLARVSGMLYLPPFQGDDQGNLVPGVCVDCQVSEDGLSYRLILDPDARFSDGSKVTAEDIKFTWEYVASPASGNPWQYYQTAPVLGHQDVFEGNATEMDGLTVIDDETLDVRLARPFALFIGYLTQCLNGIHQRENIVEGGEDWDLRPPIACGPFAIESFDVQTGEIIMAPNPYWWRNRSPLQRIEYRLAPDPNSLSVLWSNDEIDIQEIPINLAAQIVNSDQRDLIVDTPVHGLFVLVLRSTVPPMDDVSVRRALLHATDTDTVVDAVFQGAYEPASTFSHPLVPGFQDRPPFYDPEGARAALAESGYGSADALAPIVFSVSPTSPYRFAVEAFQQTWQEVLGVEPAILPSDPGFDPEEIGANVFTGGPSPLFLDAGGIITWAFKPDNIYFRNTIQADDPELDALIEQAEALGTDDTQARADLYRQAEERLFDQAYMIPYAYSRGRNLVKPWVANARFRPDASPIITDMYIAER